MGEYYRVVNLDKRQCFSGRTLGLCQKFHSLQSEPMSSLVVWVLAKTAHLRKPPLLGSWAGDAVMIVGDEGDAAQLYEESETFDDISVALIEEWIDFEPIRVAKYWERGLVNEDGRFVLDDEVRKQNVILRKGAEFTFEQWEARHLGGSSAPN